ncbi:MAG: hypothetical protein WKF73_18405 [Nocardioidaceae bacterium]
MAELLTRLGVRPEHFAVRPLLRRGLSGDGLDIGEDTTVPELTASADGLHWHPAGADAATKPRHAPRRARNFTARRQAAGHGALLHRPPR